MTPAPLWKRMAALLTFILALILFLSCATRALTPAVKHLGVDWRQYRREKRDSLNVLFIGSSFLYYNVCPGEIYRRTGYTGYQVGGPALEPVLSYYYLKEALRTQAPDLVFIDLNRMDAAPSTVVYPEVNISWMPFSVNRIAAAVRCVPREKRAGLIFPLYSYHDGWNEISLPDAWRRLTDRSTDPLAGYHFRGGVPGGSFPNKAYPDASSQAFAQNLSYLFRIRDLCGRRGITVVFCLMAPCDQVDQAAFPWERLPAGDNVLYFNAADYAKAQNIGPSDYFDPGHMTGAGAQKLSAAVSDFLLDNQRLLSQKTFDPALWEARVAYFDSLLASPPPG